MVVDGLTLAQAWDGYGIIADIVVSYLFRLLPSIRDSARVFLLYTRADRASGVMSRDRLLRTGVTEWWESERAAGRNDLGERGAAMERDGRLFPDWERGRGAMAFQIRPSSSRLRASFSLAGHGQYDCLDPMNSPGPL